MSTYHVADNGVLSKQVAAIHKLAKIRGHKHVTKEEATYVFSPKSYIYEISPRKYFYEDAWEILPSNSDLTNTNIIEALTMFFSKDLGSKKLGTDLIFSSDPKKYKDIQYFVEFVLSQRKCEFYSSVRDLFTTIGGMRAFMVDYNISETKLFSAPLMFIEYVCNYIIINPETTLSIMNKFQEVLISNNSIMCKIQFS